MQITVKRTFKGPEYTIGKLYIDGAYFCDTLEDTVRAEKIAGKTAIPAGKYKGDKDERIRLCCFGGFMLDTFVCYKLMPMRNESWLRYIFAL